MSNLNINFSNINSPNPFWLASGPPTNTADQIIRAFDAGWGGAVWKTIGEQFNNFTPRVSRYINNKEILGINNIEGISDRDPKVNFQELAYVKKNYPNNPIIASIAGNNNNHWLELIKQSEESGADGIELNLSCPNGLPEKGMCMAIGQQPKLIEEVCSLVKQATKLPVFAKLTPAITNIETAADAAKKGGADSVTLINTIPSIIGIDLDILTENPCINSKFTSGGYSGSAIKPIALHMVATVAKNQKLTLPICACGGISNWHDAVEFMVLGAGCVQVCTAVMLHGFGIINDLLSGLKNYLKEKNLTSVNELVGMGLNNFVNWNELDNNYKVAANINSATCINCKKCLLSCQDGGHQAINDGVKTPVIDKKKCVGCGLCSLVCPTGSISKKLI